MGKNGLSPHIALIGCGRWGMNILRDLRRLGAEVTVVDPSPLSRSRALEGGARAATDRFPASATVDGIIIATPATTHAEVITAVLEGDVPIFVEKPFTTSVRMARTLAQAAPDRLFVMHNWRYHAGVQLLSQIGRSGELGPLHGIRTIRTNWTSPRTDADAFWTLLPHDLSIALAILGDIPTPRYALAERGRHGVVGIFAAMQDSAWMIVEASNRYADKRREIRLHCRDGVAVLPHGEASFVDITADDKLRPLTPHSERRFFQLSPPLRTELAVFVEHICGGSPPHTDVKEGLKVVEAVVKLRVLAGVEEPD